MGGNAGGGGWRGAFQCAIEPGQRDVSIEPHRIGVGAHFGATIDSTGEGREFVTFEGVEMPEGNLGVLRNLLQGEPAAFASPTKAFPVGDALTVVHARVRGRSSARTASGVGGERIHGAVYINARHHQIEHRIDWRYSVDSVDCILS